MKLTLIKGSDKKLSEAFQINDEEVKLQEAEQEEKEPEEVDIPELSSEDLIKNNEESNLLQPDQNIENNEINDEKPAEEDTSDPNAFYRASNDDKNSVVVNNLNGLVDNIWSSIDILKNAKSLMEIENLNIANQDSIQKLIEDLIDDLTIDIGVVYKLIELVNPKLSLLINKGQNKASEKLLGTTTDGVDNLSTL